ncbi:MAG TPA: ATP-binding protein [Polyangiaceae bacterium]|nr:ATP-binding protein [Polyangiaceae bacterium]
MRGFKLNADVAARHRDAVNAPNTLSDAYGEVVGVGLLSLRDDGTIIAYTPLFAQMCALPPRGLESPTLSKLVEWLLQQRDELSVALAKLLSEDPGRCSGELTSSDGRTLEWRRAAIAGNRGYVWAIANVSEARQMAAALVDAAGWLRMLEAHTDGVLLELDAAARIVGLWGPGRQFFDEPDALLQGKTLVEVIAGPEGAALDARVRRALSSALRQDYECCVEIGGTQRVLSTSAVLMAGINAAPPGVTLMIRDVTERAHMQAKLLQVERLASVGLLAAGVAHEVNNPLTYVLLNLERVRSKIHLLAGAEQEALRAELGTALDMSIEGATRVQAIVRDLNRFCRPDDNRRLPIDVHRSLDFAIAMAEPELQGRAKLVRDYGPLPHVRASEARLSQVFLNLVINAAHALSEAGKGYGEIRVVTCMGPQGQAIIEVHDNGRGMSSSALRHVFEPFYTTKAPGTGTGLGLTICRDIVVALGGQIEVSSSEGCGSVFRVVLPPAALPPAALPPAALPPAVL